jgi:hypothetical protein
LQKEGKFSLERAKGGKKERKKERKNATKKATAPSIPFPRKAHVCRVLEVYAPSCIGEEKRARNKGKKRAQGGERKKELGTHASSPPLPMRDRVRVRVMRKRRKKRNHW